MTTYNKEDVHRAAKNVFETVGHLITVLNGFDGDFGGPEGEVEWWIDELKDVEETAEFFMEITE